VRLNCTGTLEDLAQQHIQLREGLLLTLYADDLNDQGQLDELCAEGVVTYSEAEHGWVALIDWAALRHASGHQGPDANGASPDASAPSVDPGLTKGGS
jgi:hypothetical protein